MRGRDPDSGEFLAPSRSERRREALAVFDLAERLAVCSDAQLARLPTPEHLLDPIRHARGIHAQIARKRELQHLAKLLRREPAELLDAVRAALEHDKAPARRESSLLHRAEVWRERLIEDGDAALDDLIAAHPDVGTERQRLRQLIRLARRERERSSPPHGQRELFRALRELIDPATSNLRD